MKDKIISLDTAKLAKEKGFTWSCAYSYAESSPNLDIDLHLSFDLTGETVFTIEDIKAAKENGYEAWLVPTQSLLQKWLRDVHNIDVWAQPFVLKQDTGQNSYLPDETYSYFIYKDGSWKRDSCDYLDFEEALEAGLQEALKLI